MKSFILLPLIVSLAMAVTIGSADENNGKPLCSN